MMKKIEREGSGGLREMKKDDHEFRQMPPPQIAVKLLSKSSVQRRRIELIYDSHGHLVWHGGLNKKKSRAQEQKEATRSSRRRLLGNGGDSGYCI